MSKGLVDIERKENKDIFLIVNYEGVEIDWAINKLQEEKLYYSLPIVTTRECVKDEELDKYLFVSKSTFHRKALNSFDNGDFFVYRNVDGDYEGILRNAWWDIPRLVPIDEEICGFTSVRLKKLGYNVKTILFTLDEKFQVHKLGIERRLPYRKIQRILDKQKSIIHEDFDEVIDGRYEGDIIKYFTNLTNKKGVQEQMI